MTRAPILLLSLALPIAVAVADAAEEPRTGALRWNPAGALTGPHREPSVAIARDGGFAIAWSAVDGAGRGRIVMSMDADAPEVIDLSDSGDNREPVVAYAPGRTLPTLAWIHRDRDAQAVMFRDLARREPLALRQSRTAYIEGLVLGFLDAETPAVAWAELDGTTSSVWFAWRFNGSWEVRRVSREDATFDAQPQFLSLPAPRLCWYALDNAETLLRCADVALWGIGRAEDMTLTGVALHRLPILVDAPPGPLPQAGWIEPTAEGDQLVIADPRRGRREGTDPRPAALNQFDPSFFAGGFAALEELADGSRRLRVMLADGAELLYPTGPAARQAAAAHRDGLFVAAWVNDRTEGGDGSLEALVARTDQEARGVHP